ncbi:MAG: hypothetical protein QG594_2548 [Bacteroidota bacterium]|jgi:hypothetical protein|nr:hypothetical protein [Bacteroidota bacterium]
MSQFENQNQNENNESLPMVNNEVVDKELSIDEFSEYLNKEEGVFKQETTDEIGLLNSINLDDQTFEQAKIESGIDSELNNINEEAETVFIEAKEKVNTLHHFNLEKPEGYKKDRPQKVVLNEVAEQDANFDELNKSGQKIQNNEIDEKEKRVSYVDYEVSPSINLRVRGDQYTYTEKDKDSNNYITAMYQKDLKKLYKMSFESENPIFAGKAIMDMVGRIPAGTEMLRGESSFSTDSFPLLLNTFLKYNEKDLGSLNAEQIGEFELNDSGKYSNISKLETPQEKIMELNNVIHKFSDNLNVNLSDAKVGEDGKNIVVPKIVITKNR